MWEHLEATKGSATRDRLKEDIILLVVVVLQCLRSVSLVMNKLHGSNWAKMHEFFNYMGYRTCLRYLGKGSAFTKRFQPVEKEFKLPVLRPAEREPAPQADNNG